MKFVNQQQSCSSPVGLLKVIWLLAPSAQQPEEGKRPQSPGWLRASVGSTSLILMERNQSFSPSAKSEVTQAHCVGVRFRQRESTPHLRTSKEVLL